MKALTALTFGKPAASGSGIKPLPRAEPQSDVLFEMFNGALGSVHLGRMLKGNDAGRLVTLRKLPATRSEELTAAADLARSVAHPKLVKLLGIITEQNARYLASEHISGVTLFELGRTASNRQLPVLPHVAVRIVIDALSAAEVAHGLLTETLHSPVVRCVYPECVWIADFGETFLAEVLVSSLLGRKPNDDSSASEAALLALDVRTAALELIRMVCAGLSPDDPLDTDLSHLPEDLQEVLMPALGHGSMVGYSSPQEFLDALATLDDSLIATEAQVAEELRRLMGTVLTVRRQKLDMLERGASADEAIDQGDETKFFRLALKTEQRVTARPPPESAAMPAAQLRAAVASPIQPVLDASADEPADEPTMLLIRGEDGSTRSNLFASGAPSTSGPESEAPLSPSLFESAVHRRQSLSALLAREADTPEPVVQPKRRGVVLLAVVAGVVLLTGLRLGWLMHRDHTSANVAFREQTRALGLWHE